MYANTIVTRYPFCPVANVPRRASTKAARYPRTNWTYGASGGATAETPRPVLAVISPPPAPPPPGGGGGAGAGPAPRGRPPPRPPPPPPADVARDHLPDRREPEQDEREDEDHLHAARDRVRPAAEVAELRVGVRGRDGLVDDRGGGVPVVLPRRLAAHAHPVRPVSDKRPIGRPPS